MDTAAERQMKRLKRALSVSTNDLDREQYAFAIAELKTPAAYRALVDEVVRKSRPQEACAAALRRAGSLAVPLILDALHGDPDNRYLPASLTAPCGDDTVEVLIRACKRTTDEWVVLVATQLLAATSNEQLQRLGAAVLARGSEVFTAAMHCALVGERDAGDVAVLARYLTPSTPVKVQDLALAFRPVRDLPAAQDLLRQRIRKGRVGDRAHALRLVALDRRTEFADLVLDVWLNDKSPTVEQAALSALRTIGTGLEPSIRTRADSALSFLEEAVAAVLEGLSPGTATIGEEMRAPLDAVDDLVEQFGRLWLAAVLSGSDAPEIAIGYAAAYRRLAPRLTGAAMALQGELREALLRLADLLITRQRGVLRHLWVNGDASVRVPALEILGLPIAAHDGYAPSASPGPRGKLPWDRYFGELRECCQEIVCGWWRLNWGVPENLVAAKYPLAALTQLRQRIAGLITTCEIEGHVLLPALLSALTQSQEAEREARARAERALEPQDLGDIQQEFDEQHLLLLCWDKTAIAEFLRGQESPRNQIPTRVQIAGPMLAEQLYQVVLLNTIAAHLSPKAAGALIGCTASESALVIECAQALLVRIGLKTLTKVEMAVAHCPQPRQLAHLLEVCRCLDATRASLLARDYLASEEPLVAAVCCRILEEAGTADDAVALKRTLVVDDELVTVMALRALARLSPDAALDEFTAALSHPSGTVRFAGLWGLQRCADDVKQATAEILASSEDAFQRLYGRGVLDRDGFLDLCPRFAGDPPAVGGSYVLGDRCMTLGRAPWQWGLADLYGDNGDVDWSRLWPVMAKHDELARDWVDYSLRRGVPSSLLPRLAAIARDREDRGDADQARGMLLVLARDTLRPLLQAAGYYYGCPYEAVLDAAPVAFVKAVRACTTRVTHGLEMPNPSMHNPLGEGSLLEFVDESSAFGVAFAILFRRSLREVLEVPRPPELDSDDDAIRQTAMELQWLKVMSCMDFIHGLWIEPLIAPEDILWYCRRRGADQTTRQEMIGYLVGSVCLLPHLPDTGEAHRHALRRMFGPLLRKTYRGLSEVLSTQTEPEEVAALIDEAFWAAVETYDALEFWPVEAHLPLGTLRQFGGHPATQRPDSTSDRSRRPYMPFPLFVERRLQALIRAERAKARRAVRETQVAHEGDFEADVPVDVQEQWRNQHEDLLDALDSATAPDPEDLAILSLAQIDPGWLSDHTERIPIDGESVPCVDIESVAEQTGKSAEALRKRHQRGGIGFVIHKGIRYLPVTRLPEVIAETTSDAEIAAKREVHRNTVAKWRREAPPGLNQLEMVKHLLTRPKEKRGRRPRSNRATD